MRIITEYNRPTRRGAVVLVVVACLVLLAMIGAALVRIAQARRERVDLEGRMIQARWLVDSGLERAAARLASDGDYRGETWEVPAEALGGRSGVVRIVVEAGPDPAGSVVLVEADYPGDSPTRARRRGRFLVGRETGAEAPGEGP